MSPRRTLILLFAVFAVPPLVLGQTSWALMLLGVVLGAGIAQTNTLDAARELLRAAAPLALPLLVIVVVGTIDVSPWLGFAAGVAFALIAWTWIVRPDLSNGNRDANGALRSLLPRLGRCICVVLGAIAVDEAG